MEEREFQASRLLKALANPIRYRMVKKLADRSLSPAGLCKAFGRKPASISQHLKVLHDADVVWFHKVGGETVYEIKDRDVLGIIETAEELGGRRNLGPEVRGKRARK